MVVGVEEEPQSRCRTITTIIARHERKGVCMYIILLFSLK